MKCTKCGYDDSGTGDAAHVCLQFERNNLKDVIAEFESTQLGKEALQAGREWVKEKFYGDFK